MQRLVPGLIGRAAEIFGGLPALAQHLGVAEHALGLWATGKASAPVGIVEVLVDLVLKDDIARAKGDRRHEPRAVAEHTH